jgi:hypothetical protein
MVNAKNSPIATEAFVKKEVNKLREDTYERFTIVDEKLDMIDQRQIAMYEKIDAMDKKLDEKFRKVLELLDRSAGDYQKFDEEKTILSGRQSEHSDEIEELRNRILKLERIVHSLTTQ